MKKVAIIGLSGNSIFYSIDKLPTQGETKKANSFFEEVGGKGFNQAVACKRLGFKVSFLTAIGKDLDGKKCIDFLNNEGISSYAIYKKSHTAVASILTDSCSNNEVIVYHGANNDLCINDLKKFEKEILMADCVLITYEVPYDVLKYVLEFCNKNDKYVMLNPAPYIYDDVKLLEYANIITPNETEACQIAGIESFDIFKITEAFNKLKINNYVITLGNNGCFAYADGNGSFIEGIKVEAVDTTGAGDVFNASLLYKLMEKEDLFSACKFANIQASKSVTIKHVMDSIPYLKK